METILTWAVAPFFVGLVVMLAGHVVYETSKGIEQQRGMAAVTSAFQIWALGAIAIAVYLWA